MSREKNKTLHLFRSPPDKWVNLLASQGVGAAEGARLRLYGRRVNYAKVLESIIAHDRVICWW